MCDYCNGDEMTQLPLPDPLGITLDETGVFTVLPNPYGGYMLADIIMPTSHAQYAEIKYCPMCGKKLAGSAALQCYFCGKYIKALDAVSVSVPTDCFEPTDPPERQWICKRCNSGEIEGKNV